MLFTFCVGWQGHTDESRVFAQHVALALDRAGISRKEAAAIMEISEAQLSRQINGQEGLNLWKAAKLPKAFHRELIRLRAEYIGSEVVELEELRELVNMARTLVPALRKGTA